MFVDVSLLWGGVAMASKRFRGRSWEYVVRRSILDRPIYLTFATEAEGDAYVARLERLLDSGVVPEEFRARGEGLRSVSDLMGAYQRAVAVPGEDRRLLRVLDDRIGGERLVTLDYAWAEAWVAGMKRTRNLAPGTIRHYVGALARCLDWALSAGHVSDNPLRRLPKRYARYTDEDRRVVPARVDQHRDRRLLPGEEEEIRRLLRGGVPDGRQRALTLEHGEAYEDLFTLALETGMRLSEMFTLRVRQVSVAQRTVSIERSKNGRRRQVPLSSVAVEVMRRRVEGAGGDKLVFPFWAGTDADLPRCRYRLSRFYGRLFRAAGCEDLRFHDLRHEATCRLYQRTRLSDVEIARILGWSSLDMALRYANIRGSDLADGLW